MDQRKLKMIEESNLNLYLMWEYQFALTKNELTADETLRNFIKERMPQKTSKEVSDFLDTWRFNVVIRFRTAKQAQIGYLRQYGWSINRIRKRMNYSPNYVMEHEHTPYDFLVLNGDKGNKYKIHKRELERMRKARENNETIPSRLGYHGENDKEHFAATREFLYELYPHIQQFLKEMNKLGVKY